MPRILCIRLALGALVLGLATALSVLSAVAARTADGPTSRVAGISGAGASGLQITNLDPATALQSHVGLYRQGGGDPIELAKLALPPLASYSFYLPQEASLRNGAYAGMVTGNVPFGLLSRTEWPATGAVVMSGAAVSGTALSVPMWRPGAGLYSLISIQNLNTSGPVQLAVQVVAADGSPAMASRTYHIEPGTSITLDAQVDPSFADLPADFVGVMHVTAPTAIAVQSIVDLPTTTRATFGLDVLPDASAATTWFAPRVRSEDTTVGSPATILHDTGLVVVNPGAQSAEVSVAYRGSSGSCAGQTLSGGQFTIPAGGMRTLAQGARADGPGTVDSHLPAGCSAAATLTATGPVTAYVVDAGTDVVAGRAAMASATSAIAGGAGSRRFLLPLWRRNHTSQKLTTDVALMNLGQAPATVELTVRLASGEPVACSGPCLFSIPAGATVLIRPEETSAGDGEFGSAVLDSDQLLAVVVDDTSRSAEYDAAAYVGQAIDVPTIAAGSIAAAPLLLRSGGSSPTPTPGGTGLKIFVVGFVDVAGGSDPSCPGCNGEFDPADANYAATHPLPNFTMVIRAADGSVVAQGVTELLTAGIVRKEFQVPKLAPDQTYTVELAGAPVGWTACAVSPGVRTLRPEDFQLGTVRVEYNFHDNACSPIPPTVGPSPTPELVPTAALPVPKVDMKTGIQATNLGDEMQDLQFGYVPSSGGPVKSIAAERVPVGGNYTSYLPALAGLADGTYGGLVSGTGPLGTVAWTVWQNRSTIGMDNALPATDVVVPLAATGPLGLNTILGVQNLDAAAAVEVSVTALNVAGATVATGQLVVPAGAAVALDLGRDPAFEGLGLQFIGSLRLRAPTRIAVHAALDFEHSDLAAVGFNGQPAVSAQEVLWVPRVQSAVALDLVRPAAGHYVTRLAIVNPGAAEVSATVSYLGEVGACAANAVLGQARTLPPGGLAWFDVTQDGLPPNCSAAARIQASGPVLAVGVETSEAMGVVRTAAGFNALETARADRRVHLSILRNQHLNLRMSTDVSVQNTSDVVAEASLSGVMFDGSVLDCGASCQASIAPGATHTFRAEDLAGFPVDKFGWGRVDSSQPVVVNVADLSRNLMQDGTIVPGQSVSVATSGPYAFPIAARHGSLRRPGPPLTPYEPPRVDPPSLTELAGVRTIYQLFLPAVAGAKRAASW